jgi:arylsulfatase A-like enzyme
MMVFAVAAFGQNSKVTTNAPANPPARPRMPTIILIVAEGVGEGDLGCYGQTNIQTPNLDRLAAEGVRFTACYAGSPGSTASRASLLTGKPRGESRDQLLAGDVTIAEALTNAGYFTVAYGQWGLGGDATPGAPGKQGFDSWCGYLEATNADDYYPTNLNRFSRARMATGPEKEIVIPENFDHQKGKYSDDFFTEAALNCLRLYQPQPWTHYRPFFLFLPYTIARPNLALAAATGNGMEIPAEDHAYDGKPWPQPEKNRAAMISRLDRYVGAMREKMKELKMDNTMIIFTSATAPLRAGGVDPKFFQSTGPFRGSYGDLYEGGIRVPLIIWWDRRFPAGTVSEVPCALWDLPATIADLALIPGFDTGAGISLKPALSGQAQTNRHESFYWETGPRRAARMGDWKGVRLGQGAPLELYNLKDDPGEQTNVAGRNPRVVARLEKLMKTAGQSARAGTATGSK